jgi:hypothetical protein
VSRNSKESNSRRHTETAVFRKTVIVNAMRRGIQTQVIIFWYNRDGVLIRRAGYLFTRHSGQQTEQETDPEI